MSRPPPTNPSVLLPPVWSGLPSDLQQRAVQLLAQLAYSQLRRESMRARQNLELYCEEFLSRRAKPPDKHDRATSITLRGGNKQAM